MFHTAGSKPNGARQSRQARPPSTTSPPGGQLVRHFSCHLACAGCGFCVGAHHWKVVYCCCDYLWTAAFLIQRFGHGLVANAARRSASAAGSCSLALGASAHTWLPTPASDAGSCSLALHTPGPPVSVVLFLASCA